MSEKRVPTADDYRKVLERLSTHRWPFGRKRKLCITTWRVECDGGVTPTKDGGGAWVRCDVFIPAELAR